MLRLADLLADLSRTADMGFGLQPGEALRSSALALLLGRSAGYSDNELRGGMYGSLLLHLGCTAYAHETAHLFGDELAHNAAVARVNVADPKDIITSFVPALVRGKPPIERIKLGFNVLARGKRFGKAYETAACEVGRAAARRLRLPGGVQNAVYHSFEWWNGGGVPDGFVGEEIPAGSRLTMVASVAAVFQTVGGREAAVAAVREQAGSILDPELADHFASRAGPLLAELDATDPRALVVDAEPDPPMRAAEGQLADVAAVFGDVVDLKTPFTHGHARGVADVARRAGEQLGLSADDVGDLEVAALLHDLGRVAVPNTIWEKPGPLSAHEWEQVRLHPYYSERIVASSGPLASLAPIIGAHHERLDGGGYHRGCGSGDLSIAARILAAADAYQAMTEERPYRGALEPEQAQRQLLDDARSGALDADAVTAVLAVAGHDAIADRPLPAGLTEREVEVLGLLAQGNSNRQIAEELVISRRTAEHHVQSIYTKIGASNRAAGALFAIEHGLVRRPR